MSPHIILNPHKYSHIYITQIFSMLLGLHKYSIHKPINCFGPSHKYYPLYPTYYPTRIFHKNTHHATTKIGPQNYAIPTKNPKLIYLVGKAQNGPTISFTKPIATQHLKARCYTTPLKSVVTQHLKARCYTTILYKISKSFSQNPNTYLTLFLQSPNTNLATIFFTKLKY